MVGQIVQGHFNELLNLEQSLYNKRKPICNKCKLKVIKTVLGISTEICSPDIYMNPTTDEVSITPKQGFLKGCGCRVESSTRVKDKQCPLGKW